MNFLAGPTADRDTMAAVPIHHPGASEAARPAEVPPPGPPY